MAEKEEKLEDLSDFSWETQALDAESMNTEADKIFASETEEVIEDKGSEKKVENLEDEKEKGEASGTEEEDKDKGEKGKIDTSIFDDVSTTDDNQEDAPTGSETVATLNFLKDKGFADFELGEDEELTEDLASEIIEDSIEQGIQKKVGEALDSLPPEVQELVKYSLNGGSLDEYVQKTKSTSTSYTEEFDLDEEGNQEKFLRDYLKAEGFEDVEEQLEYYKESNKLETVAKKNFKRYSKTREENKKKLVKAKEEEQRQLKVHIREQKNSIREVVKEGKGLELFDLKAKDARDLPSRLYDRNVKLENGNYITESQKDLYMALQDPKKQIIIDTLVKNDFNFDKILKKAETKVAKTVKKDIRRGKGKNPSKSGGNTGTQSLADILLSNK